MNLDTRLDLLVTLAEARLTAQKLQSKRCVRRWRRERPTQDRLRLTISTLSKMRTSVMRRRRLRGRIISLALLSAVAVSCADGHQDLVSSSLDQKRMPDAWAQRAPEPVEGFTRHGQADRQAFLWLEQPTSTRSSRFIDLPGLSGLEICQGEFGASAALSLTLKGSRAVVRVVGEKTLNDLVVMQPARVSSERPLGSQLLSWTFVTPKIDRTQRFSVQWKSPTGHRIIAQKGTLVLYYGSQKKGDSGCL